ncbi:MAG TPA: HDIG domain-containing protein [Candidatus Dormibacteraeota bacterium]|jgi:putative nucleotidyltransferase with HDIG domain|nr:HDIG domain-containing protein [Candidatus Dormibacteraeota bacterium]
MAVGARASQSRWRYRVGQVIAAARARNTNVDVEAVLRDLPPGLGELWLEMAPRDMVHSLKVFRRVAGDELLVRQAALLHDVGKARAPLGTIGRSLVVLAERFGATVALDAVPVLGGRCRRYRRHPEIGAEMLRQAGADPVLVEIVAEHQSPAPRHPQTARLQAVDERE